MIESLASAETSPALMMQATPASEKAIPASCLRLTVSLSSHQESGIMKSGNEALSRVALTAVV